MGAIKQADNQQQGQEAPQDLAVVDFPHSPYLAKPIRSEAEVQAERAVNRLRKPVLSGRSVNVDWYWPGSDSKLVLEVDHDHFGSRYFIEVTDENGNQFPFEAIELNGKPLEDVLSDFLNGLPELELPE